MSRIAFTPQLNHAVKTEEIRVPEGNRSSFECRWELIAAARADAFRPDAGIWGWDLFPNAAFASDL